MNYPTKEQLEEWRGQGKTNVEIAEFTGRSIGTINCLFSKYKISSRRRAIPQDKIDAIYRMRKAGSSTKEIMEITGCGESTIKNYIKAAGLAANRKRKDEPEPEQEFPTIFAVPEEPRAEKIVVDGKQYWDITDFWLPR